MERITSSITLPLIRDGPLIVLVVSHVPLYKQKSIGFLYEPCTLNTVNAIYITGGFSGVVLHQFFRAQFKRHQNKVGV